MGHPVYMAIAYLNKLEKVERPPDVLPVGLQGCKYDAYNEHVYSPQKADTE